MTAAFQPYDLKALYALDLPRPEYLVDEMLPLGALALLSAREKAGKGLLSIDLCACIAAGEPFIDAAVMEGPVIYCAAEENLRDVRTRIRHRLGNDPGYPFLVLQLNGSTDARLRLEDASTVEQLALMIAERRPLLVVLDTLRELHNGHEDSSDDMGPRMRPLRELAHQTNTTILVNHHMSKAGGFRGSTAIRAAADLEWAFTRSSEGDTLMGSLRVEGRHGPRQTSSIRFDPATWRWGLTVAPVVADSSLRGRILHALENAHDWRDAAELAEALGVKLKTVQNEFARMTKENPQPFAIDGMASRGRPRRFHTLNRRLDADDLSLSGPERLDIGDSRVPESLGAWELRNSPYHSRDGSRNDPAPASIESHNGKIQREELCT